MKKILISIVLATFCLSVPVFGGAPAAITPAAEATPVASAGLPIPGQPRFRRRRFRRTRRIVLRRQYRRVNRRNRYIMRHRRR